MSINLEKVVCDASTAQLFAVARRTGGEKDLSEFDALNYMMYLDRYNRCGKGSSAQEEICKQRVNYGDYSYVRLGWYSEDGVIMMLRELPKARQVELQNKAKQFLDNAQLLIQKK